MPVLRRSARPARGRPVSDDDLIVLYHAGPDLAELMRVRVPVPEARRRWPGLRRTVWLAQHRSRVPWAAYHFDAFPTLRLRAGAQLAAHVGYYRAKLNPAAIRRWAQRAYAHDIRELLTFRATNDLTDILAIVKGDVEDAYAVLTEAVAVLAEAPDDIDGALGLIRAFESRHRGTFEAALERHS